jgi:HSP20 family molecular chaperone IbpA
MSFLQKLKGEGVELDKDEKADTAKKEEDEDPLKGIAQLDIDLYQTDAQIIVYALVGGASMEDLTIAIEGDNDIVTIQGNRERPEHLAYVDGALPEGTYFTEEVDWGKFYRKIILPEPIDIAHAQAQIRHGVLVVKLPIHGAESKSKVKLKVTTLDDDDK